MNTIRLSTKILSAGRILISKEYLCHYGISPILDEIIISNYGHYLKITAIHKNISSEENITLIRNGSFYLPFNFLIKNGIKPGDFISMVETSSGLLLSIPADRGELL